jgi:hypothetical protein
MPERALTIFLAAAMVLAALARPCQALEAGYLDGSAVGGAPLAVAAAPGVSLGVILTPPGEPAGAPLVLEVSLEHPGEALAPAVRWQAAAYAGSPVRLTWEFAYPFEVQAGTWTMRVSQDGRELAWAAFEVTPAPEAASGPAARAEAAPGAQPPIAGIAPPVPPGGRTQAPPAESGKPAKPGQAVLPPSAPPAREPAPGTSAPSGQPVPDGKAKSDAKPPAAEGPAARPAGPGPGKTPPRAFIGGDPGRRVYAVLAGTFSEEARALWVASFLKQKSGRACVRKRVKDGRTLYAVVAGWSETREGAAELKRSLEGVAPGSLVIAFAAGELEAGLSCR